MNTTKTRLNITKDKGHKWGSNYGFTFFGFGGGGQSNKPFLCLHDEKNSDLEFMVAPSGLNIMKYFSLRQSLHWLVIGL